MSQHFFRVAAFCSGPLAFSLILLFVPTDVLGPGSAKALAVASWMIIWWITEAAPIPVTALLPLLLFPFLGVMKMSEAAAPYANPVIFLFMGGFLIAMALEKHRLHERIALNLIRLTGTSGNGIILGFMIATAVLSMWISNTATAIMMLPIAMSVINLLKTDKGQAIHELDIRERNLALGLMLSIGYAASLGGIATIIGTPPNAVFKGLYELRYQKTINFGEWMLVGVPVAVILLASTYIILTRVLFRSGIKRVEGTELLLREKLNTLGPISRTEKRVLAVFAVTSILWIFQAGINALVERALFNDSNVAMLGGILMFLVPADLKKMEFILDWKDTRILQWGILILFGGGLCLASGLQSTGIIESIGSWIADRSAFDVKLMLLLLVASVVLTEFMSNVALVQIFVPVVFGIADGLNVNPILLALPVTLGSSMAFMFPISTPPNAIVFSSGYIRIRDMVRAGILLNIVSIFLILVVSMTLVKWVFE